MRVKSGFIYEHEEKGNVLVTMLAEVYKEMSTDGQDKDGQRVVFFTNRFDGYGSMGGVITEELSEFVQKAELVGEHDYVEAPENDED